MKYNGIIENKLRLLEKKTGEIKSWNIKSIVELQENSMLNNALERALQVSIEIMIDISERILALEKIPPQNFASDSIRKLAELNIIKDYSKYIDMVKFRNFIVHRYEYIDLDILFNIAKNKLPYFDDFVNEIRKT